MRSVLLFKYLAYIPWATLCSNIKSNIKMHISQIQQERNGWVSNGTIFSI